MKRVSARVAGCAIAVALLVGCGGAASSGETSSPSPAASTPEQPRATFTVAPEPTPIPDMAEIHTLLHTDEALDIAIFSDSTADEPTEWPALWADEMSSDQAVTLNRWLRTPEKYQAVEVSTAGPERVVWNCAVSGWKAMNFYDRVDDCLPVEPDLVIISLGHNNASDPSQAVPQLEILLGIIRYHTTSEVPIVITMQNPVTTPDRADASEQVVNDEREWVHANRYPMIDAYQAFWSAPEELSALLKEDGLHPSELGSQVWADAVVETLTPWRA